MRTARTYSLCVLVALFLLLSGGCAHGDSEFNAKEFFLGEWDISVQVTEVGNPAQVGKVDMIAFHIKDGNETLFGSFDDEHDDERPLRIEFEESFEGKPTAGEFLLASPEDEEEEFTTVFRFEFVQKGDVFTSQGVWKDEFRGESGVYQLLALSPNSFVVTVLLRNPASGEIYQMRQLLGKKFVTKEPPGFFAKYGMPLSILAFFLISQLLKRQVPAPEQQQQPGAAQEGRAPAATSAGSSSTKKDD
ncbi:hypothetical protein QOT17_011046 [Balamuthia mandrillaris]